VRSAREGKWLTNVEQWRHTSSRVRLRDGSCMSLLNDCTTKTFNSYDQARDASRVLLEQVFIGSGYTTKPQDISGISATDRALILTHYATRPPYQISRYYTWTPHAAYVFVNSSAGTTNNLAPTNWGWDTTDVPDVVYAVWEASAVPVPAAAWLFGSALLGLASIKRRK
jgi:hypothetical protein